MSTATLPESVESGALINDRYRVVRELGRGGMGDVCLVHDTFEDGRPLALKRLRRDRMDSRSESVLRNEFLTMAGLPHPNLARVYDFGVDQKSRDLFFTAEFVEGSSWLDASRNLTAEDPEWLETLLGVLGQVLRGLEFIHCHGLIHGDIKPENLLVRSCLEDVRAEALVKIIDFGIVRREGAPREEKILGTPYYVAPETILGYQIDRRSDLYSLGIVLYHIVAGRPPFLGSSNLEILKSHVERQPSPSRKYCPSLPEELDQLILRFLEKKPERRFQSALDAIEHINRALGTTIPLETSEGIRCYPEAATLVGLEVERERLHSVLLEALGLETSTLSEGGVWAVHPDPTRAPREEGARRFKVPPGRLVLVRGSAGHGKRRLAEDLRRLAQILDVRFLTVECREVEGRSAGGVEALIHELSRFDWAGWKRGVPPHIQAALMISGERGGGEPQELGESLTPAIEEVATSLLESSRRQPTVLHFHDLQDASEPIVKLLRTIVTFCAECRVPDHRFMATATVRGSRGDSISSLRDIERDHALREKILEIEVPRFDESGVRRFLDSAFPLACFSERFATRIFEESDGNLGQVLTILSHFLDRQKICRRVDGWELEGDFENEDFPGRIRGELKDRLQKLSSEALQLASAFACLGDVGDLTTAVAMASLGSSVVASVLRSLQSERILEPRDAEQHRFGFVHATYRALLYQQMAPELRTRFHEQVGSLLESRNGQITEVAFHYLRAGNREKGLRYGLEAAKSLANEASLLESISVYEEILKVVGSEDSAESSAIRKDLASLRFLVGDYRGALELLGAPRVPQQLRARSGTSLSIYVEAARAHARLGHFRHAEAFLSVAIEEGNPAVACEARLALAEIRLWSGDTVGALRIARQLESAIDTPQDFSLRTRLLMLLAECRFELSDVEGASKHSQVALRLFDSQRGDESSPLSHFARGKFCFYRDRPRQAIEQLHKAQKAWSDCQAAEYEAGCLQQLGRLELLLGRAKEASRLLQAALALHERSHDLSRGIETRVLLAEASRVLGDSDAARTMLTGAVSQASPSAGDDVGLSALLIMTALSMDAGDLRAGSEYAAEASRLVLQGAGRRQDSLRLFELESQLADAAGEIGEALRRVSRGVTRSREVGDVVSEARLLRTKATLLARTGQRGPCRRDLVSLYDLSQRHGVLLWEGWTSLLEARLLAQDDRLAEASRRLAQSREIFLHAGSDRDLVSVQLDHGLLRIALGEYDRAYLNLEEGLHTAARMKLPYVEVQFFLANAALHATARSQPGIGEAIELCERAERTAAAHGFMELLWKSRSERARWMRSAGREAEAAREAVAALQPLTQVLASLSADLRESYLATSGARDLMTFATGREAACRSEEERHPCHLLPDTSQ